MSTVKGSKHESGHQNFTGKSNGKPLAKQLSNCQEFLPVFEIFIEESWAATTRQHTPAVVLEKIFYVPIPKLGHEQEQTSSSEAWTPKTCVRICDPGTSRNHQNTIPQVGVCTPKPNGFNDHYPY